MPMFDDLYKSLFIKLVVAKKKKNIHTYKYGEKQQNKTKCGEQVCLYAALEKHLLTYSH